MTERRALSRIAEIKERFEEIESQLYRFPLGQPRKPLRGRGISRCRIETRPAAHSNGEISLAALLDKQGGETGDPGLELDDLAAAICRGGWPAFRGLELSAALRRVRDYPGEIPRDTQRLGPRHRPERMMRLIQSLARNVATPVAAKTLAADASRPEDSISDDAVGDYLDPGPAIRRREPAGLAATPAFAVSPAAHSQAPLSSIHRWPSRR